MKAIIRDVLDSHLKGQTFVADHTAEWTKGIANEVRDKLKGLALGRYKYLVQVVMGEQRGQGVRMGCRCFWDSETDTEASEVFINVRAAAAAAAAARARRRRGRASAASLVACAASLVALRCTLTARLPPPRRTHTHTPARASRFRSPSQDKLFCVATAYAVYLY